ncbi:MAG: deoxyribodipyrimidine photo-lyase [Cryomorphaceae bacterium]
MELKSKKFAKERFQRLNQAEVHRKGKYVLYWMQRSQRAEWNMALEYAIEMGKKLDKGVVVCFGLMEDYPEATERHYAFMLEGLSEAAEKLKQRNIAFVLRIGHPVDVARELAGDACLVICDQGYLRHMRKWRSELADKLELPLIQVEDNAVVPVETASEKEEYAARTIRKKIHQNLSQFGEEVHPLKVAESTLQLRITSENVSEMDDLLKKLNPTKDPRRVDTFKGGTKEAKRHFRHWLSEGYHHYDKDRNEPHLENVSHMSPYLHFGQISPLWLFDQMKSKRGENKESYLEELTVRRELAINFVWFNKDYDSLKAIPEWAQETLETHKSDQREKVYTMGEMENAETHDPYWNKAMQTMKDRGYLHNHMRMYWGKQILLYTNTPQYAHKVVTELNNKYFLDGRDPNSYANIAWLFGNHDRGWTEREVFGKVRSMTKSGLERKIDTEAYLSKFEN